MVNHTSTSSNVIDNWLKSSYSVRNVLALVSLLIVGVLFLSTATQPNTNTNSLFPLQPIRCLGNRSPQSNSKVDDVRGALIKDEYVDPLQKALESASITKHTTTTSPSSSFMDKTVIITVVNKAYVEGELPNMLDLFLESLWLGQGTRSLLPHLLIVAVDDTAYQRCLFRGLHCYRLNSGGDQSNGGGGEGGNQDGEKVFMSKEFINLMWSRTSFLLDVLKRGYSFIFTDTDVMWLRNPFTVLHQLNHTVEDIQFSTDIYNGNETSEKNPINTGFYYVRSNNKTISLFSRWYELKDNFTGHKEQDVLQNLTRSGYIQQHNMTARYLETRWFSGFCSDSRDFNAVITVHANCCRYIKAKLADLQRVLVDWKRYQSLSSTVQAQQLNGNGTTTNSLINATKYLRWSAHVDCQRSWNWKGKTHSNVTAGAGN